MATTTTSEVGRDLRADRERAGLTRVQVAAAAGCSLAALANIEQGAVPRQSRVLDAARAVIAEHLNDARPADTPGAVTTSAGRGRHGSS